MIGAVTSHVADAGSDAVVAVIGGIVVAAGVAVGLMRYFDPDGSVAAQRAMEGPWGGIALGAVIAAPGVLVLLALHDRPGLLLPAGVILVPLSFLSFAGVLLPLLVVAAVLFAAYGRRSAGHPEVPWRTAFTTVVVVALLLAAAVSLFVHEDQRSYTTPTGGGSTSDVITPAETLIAVALASAAIAVGWLSSRPCPRSPAPLP
jgi:hypothetical protein